MIETDVLIIGAGTAGYVAFRAARKHTQNVKILNAGHWGTTCAMEGCMPSKLLIAAAENAHQFEVSPTYGVNLGKPEIDRKGVMNWMHHYREKWAFGLHNRATQPSDNEYYNNHIQGKGKFYDANTVQTDQGELIKFKSCVIATGSTPRLPENLNFKKTITTDSIFNLTELPESLAIVGAGVIALELGQAMSRLGVKVKFFIRDNNIGRFSDPVVKETANAIFNDKLDFEVVSNMTEETFKDYDNVLVAAGRIPNVVEGIPYTYEDRRDSSTNYDNIFIAGDVTGQMTLQHEAADEGHIAGDNAGRVAVGLLKTDGHLRSPLAVVFTDPQIMYVGEPWDHRYKVGTIDWSNQGRSNIMQKAEGITRLYFDSDDNFVGAEGIGPDAEHHAHWLAMAHQMELTRQQMIDMPFYHPTTIEGIRTALKGVK